MNAFRTGRGFTLIELIIAIVVVAISVVSILGLLSTIAARSAEALLQTQATSVASAYLDEILAQPFQDPSGPDNEATRQTFDDVDDYSALPDTRVRDQTGALVAGLDQYRVQVAVNAVTLGSGANTANALRVDVTVIDPVGASTILTGYRTNYAWQVLQ